MAAAKNTNKTQRLTSLFQRINRREDPRTLRKEANYLFTSVEPDDIDRAERDLIKIGFTAKIARQLSATFLMMALLDSTKEDLRSKLPWGHILKLVLTEHDMIRVYIAELRELTELIVQMDDLTDTKNEFRRLAHATQHLNAMREHFQREEDVIFPFLNKLGWSNLCRTEHDDHEFLHLAINDLIKLVGSFKNSKAEEFKSKLVTITGCLCPTMLEHLTREDMILYPVAYKAVENKKQWQQIKDICDKIGYCCFHV